ncbi:hypothetical protein LSM04_005296 [Trypanosoma melophagium]|uniref:uncharacterized protein n=1 Tax=Trypanosoma melophagium TaxID=715481 RepID=UPI003519EBCA|nr:hypothetical protein LSM04_005296 [Trypanosoma melophagium]
MKRRVVWLVVFLYLPIALWLYSLFSHLSDNSEGQEEMSSESVFRLIVPRGGSGTGSCHHRYAAQPGIPFPCTPRVTRHNHLSEFFHWTTAEEQRKTKLLAPVHTFCESRRVDPFPTSAERASRVRGTERLAFVGCGSSIPSSSAQVLWDYADGVSVPEDVFLHSGGNVLVSTRLVTADEEHAAFVGWSGQWHRCWIIPMTRTAPPGGGGAVYEPTCQAGDVVDVRMESAMAKVAVERVIDMDNGVLEVQFYIRKRGVYSFCADLVVRHQDMLDALAASKKDGNRSVQLLGRLSPTALLEHYGTPEYAEPGPEIMPPLNKTPAYPRNVYCITGTASTHAVGEAVVRFDDGVDVVPLPVRCDVVDDFDRFRFGGWYHVGRRCDGIHCVALGLRAGEVDPLLGSTEGWLWVSDVCQLRLFTDEELLLSLFPGAWFLGWGPSTTREPLADMLEEHLHTRIFWAFMKDLWKYPKKKTPPFYDYRMFDRCVEPHTPWSKELFRRAGNLTPSARVTLLWGGCLSTFSNRCPKRQGLILFHERINRTFGVAARRGRRDSSCGSQSFPTVLLLDHVVWRIHPNDDPAFLRAMRHLLLEQLPQLYKEVVMVSAAGDPDIAQGIHLQWAMEDDLAALYRLPDGDGRSVQRTVRTGDGAGVAYIQDNNRYPPLTAERVRQRRGSYNETRGMAIVPPVLLISRHQITLPLHFGNEFCRNGVHYGSTSGHCLTASKVKNHIYYDCVRKTWADKVLQIAWYNAMSRDKQRRAWVSRNTSDKMKRHLFYS